MQTVRTFISFVQARSFLLRDLHSCSFEDSNKKTAEYSAGYRLSPTVREVEVGGFCG